MYAVIVSRNIEFARFSDREDALVQVAILQANGRTSARVERVSL
jgi:hypothetical protein